jgi:Holliday junction DNA helicase RuvB
MNRKLWESIHTVMEPDGNGVRSMYAKLPGRKTPVLMWVPSVTFILLTNYSGKLRKVAEAAVNRCEIQHTFEPYSVDDLMAIIQNYSRQLNAPTELQAVRMIADRSLGTPRTARALFNRCRTRMISGGRSKITTDTVDAVLKLMSIDGVGMTREMRAYVEALADSDAGKLGIDTLAVKIGMDKESVTADIEPFLIRQGFVTISGGGRVITQSGLEHIGRGNPILQHRLD